SVAAFAGNKEINFYKIIQGNTNFDKISEFDVLPLDQVERCQLQVGDAVLFRPKCSFQDMEYLKAVDSFGLSDPDKEHKVTCILNDYYVFIDVPKDDPYSFPFRWVDFKRGER
ncbi:MAG TPA: hypothetical protein VF268_11220, partial [Gammaproteobacteria bacterium]